MKLAQAMDQVRNQLSRLDGALSTLTKPEMEDLLAQLPNPTALPEQLLVWRLETLLLANLYESN